MLLFDRICHVNAIQSIYYLLFDELFGIYVKYVITFSNMFH